MSSNQLDLTTRPVGDIMAAAAPTGATFVVEIGGKPYRMTLAQLQDYLNLQGAAFTIVASGDATLVAGTVAVTSTAVLSTDRIIHSRKTTGGTVGHLSIASLVDGGFTINASVNTDTSVVSWIAVRPAA
jgi:NAD/NADP transhydrogenase beta subunit